MFGPSGFSGRQRSGRPRSSLQFSRSPGYPLAGVLLAASLFTAPASALEYRSLAEASVLYDAPSQKSQAIYAIAAQTPVEVVVALGAWSKVRDAAGGPLGWVEKSSLTDRRTLQVTAPRAQVRSAPEHQAQIVFEAEKDVILDLVEILPGKAWVKVRHQSGESGYVQANQVWGL